MKKFWMNMLCVLALTLSVGVIGCSNDNSKNSSNPQDYDVTQDDIYTDNY